MKEREVATALMCQARLGMQLARARLQAAEAALDEDGSVETAMANLIAAGLAMSHCLSKFNMALACHDDLRTAAENPNSMNAEAVRSMESGITAS